MIFLISAPVAGIAGMFHCESFLISLSEITFSSKRRVTLGGTCNSRDVFELLRVKAKTDGKSNGNYCEVERHTYSKKTYFY